jgi:hypothetical protein
MLCLWSIAVNCLSFPYERPRALKVRGKRRSNYFRDSNKTTLRTPWYKWRPLTS